MRARCLRNGSPILVTRHDPKECTEPGKEEEWTVGEDMPALRDHAVFEEGGRGLCRGVWCFRRSRVYGGLGV
jgi:hypothetical protein